METIIAFSILMLLVSFMLLFVYGIITGNEAVIRVGVIGALIMVIVAGAYTMSYEDEQLAESDDAEVVESCEYCS